jgi:predicted nucleic acid-binding protein
VIVADASAVLDLLLGTDRAPAVRARLERAPLLHAPEILDLEFLSTLRRLERRSQAPPARIATAIGRLDELRVVRYPHGPLREAVWRLRHRLSAYDASYVALAQQTGFPLLTTDARLARAARGVVDLVDLG